MGRVYDSLEVNGRKFNTLFDTGSVRSYITQSAAVGLLLYHLPIPYEVGRGGKRHRIKQVCLVVGRLHGNPVDVTALVVKDLGDDEWGKPINLLFGAEAMEVWNVKIDPKDHKLDLSLMRKEFVEY
ncbi:retroviral-like aspartic protease family protein [Dehalococcoidia bacterium]|nr:retroviral-like aspartic protease family protein [Dehalococcoidia bacterium]